MEFTVHPDGGDASGGDTDSTDSDSGASPPLTGDSTSHIFADLKHNLEAITAEEWNRVPEISGDTSMGLLKWDLKKKGKIWEEALKSSGGWIRQTPEEMASKFRRSDNMVAMPKWDNYTWMEEFTGRWGSYRFGNVAHRNDRFANVAHRKDWEHAHFLRKENLLFSLSELRHTGTGRALTNLSFRGPNFDKDTCLIALNLASFMKDIEKKPKDKSAWKAGLCLLQKARTFHPTDPAVWIASAKAEEASVHQKISVSVTIKKIFWTLKSQGLVIDREKWMKEAEAALNDGFVLTHNEIAQQISALEQDTQMADEVVGRE